MQPEHERVSGSESPGRDPRGRVLKGEAHMNIFYVIGVVVVVLAVLGYLRLG